MGGYPSGQRGLTVNQLAEAFGGSNPSPPTVLSDGRLVLRKTIGPKTKKLLG